MSASWWIRRGTMEDGPFTVDQLKRMASEGELDQNVRIRLGRTTEWVEPQHMDWLQEYFGNASQTVTGKTPLEIPSIPVAPDASSDGIATPWYVFAVIGVGAMVLFGLVGLILVESQKIGEKASGELFAGSGGSSGEVGETNIDLSSSTEDLLGPKPTDPSDSDDEKSEPHEAIDFQKPDFTPNPTSGNSPTDGTSPSTGSGGPLDAPVNTPAERPTRLDGLAIVNGKDEQKISQAVGLVVCGWKGIDENGEHFEARSLPVFYDKHEIDLLSDDEKYRLVIWDSGVGAEWLLDHSGSCFMVASDGYMLTNKHVIEDLHLMQKDLSMAVKIKDQFDFRRLRPVVWVILEGKAHEAQIVHVSDRFDLAILKINISRSPYFKLASADALPRLTLVLSYGFPGASREGLNSEEDRLEFENAFTPSKKIQLLFKPSDFEYVVTRGTVSVVQDRDLSGRLIQHNADISAGNSGGPLVDENGLVWGVNTYSMTQATGGIASGIFHALMMRQLKTEIVDHVRRCTWE
jgi:S1-C subfamily serine protease